MEDDERWWINRTPDEVYQSIDAGNQRADTRDTGNKAIINKLLSDPNFHYTSGDEVNELRSDPDWNGQMTSSRSLELLSRITDGTKEDFIKFWPTVCNNLQLPEVKNIFSTYTDVVDKANSVFNRASRSELFKTYKRQPTVDLRKKYGKRE